MTPALPPARTHAPAAPRLPARTLAVTARSRFARLKLRYPATPRPWLTLLTARYPDATPHPRYDADLALELLASTGDLPGRKRDLIVILTEYRHALHAVATQALNSQTGSIR